MWGMPGKSFEKEVFLVNLHIVSHLCMCNPVVNFNYNRGSIEKISGGDWYLLILLIFNVFRNMKMCSLYMVVCRKHI